MRGSQRQKQGTTLTCCEKTAALRDESFSAVSLSFGILSHAHPRRTRFTPATAAGDARAGRHCGGGAPGCVRRGDRSPGHGQDDAAAARRRGRAGRAGAGHSAAPGGRAGRRPPDCSPAGRGGGGSGRLLGARGFAGEWAHARGDGDAGRGAAPPAARPGAAGRGGDHHRRVSRARPGHGPGPGLRVGCACGAARGPVHRPDVGDAGGLAHGFLAAHLDGRGARAR